MYLGCSYIDNSVLGHAVWESLESKCPEGDFGAFWCMLIHMPLQSLQCS